MTESEKLETKTQILRIASELFARFGFNGTSIREIAAAANVNVASVNYHFKTKHNLYWAVVQESHDWVDQGFSDIARRVNNIEEMVIESFDFLISDTDAVRTALKIMLTEGVPDPEGPLKEAIEATMGPPGSEHMIQVLRKQLGSDIPADRIFFAMNSIFGNLFHWAMLSSCAKIEMMKKKKPELNPTAIKKSLQLHARAICQFVMKNQNFY